MFLTICFIVVMLIIIAGVMPWRFVWDIFKWGLLLAIAGTVLIGFCILFGFFGLVHIGNILFGV